MRYWPLNLSYLAKPSDVPINEKSLFLCFMNTVFWILWIHRIQISEANKRPMINESDWLSFRLVDGNHYVGFRRTEKSYVWRKRVPSDGWRSCFSVRRITFLLFRLIDDIFHLTGHFCARRRRDVTHIFEIVQRYTACKVTRTANYGLITSILFYLGFTWDISEQYGLPKWRIWRWFNQ